MYYKGKWCTADGKDPLFGRVDGFQIDPKNSYKVLFPLMKRGLFSNVQSVQRMISMFMTLDENAEDRLTLRGDILYNENAIVNRFTHNLCIDS